MDDILHDSLVFFLRLYSSSHKQVYYGGQQQVELSLV